MTRTYSLRRRLGLSLAIGVTAMWLAGALVAGLVARHELDEAFDSALQETAQRLLTLAVLDILDHEGDLSERRVAPLNAHEEFLTYLVRDQFGNVILRSHDADRSVFPAQPKIGFSDTATHRIYGEAAVNNTIFIEMAEPLAHRKEAAFEATLSLIVPLALILPFSFIGVWWLVRRSMLPVLDLGTQIEARDAGDLSPVSPDGLPDEVHPIAASVNQLMARLHKSLQAERNFAANSAHELRTPIAGAIAQTQRLLASVEDDEVRARVQTIEDTLQRLAHISAKLMQLARAEGGAVLAEAEHDLGPFLDAVVDEFHRTSGDGARIEYAPANAGLLISRMDGDAFGILMRNLIENALIHSPEGAVVKITATPHCVRVVNPGGIVEGGVLATLLKPFARGTGNAEGSGLGLAIAHAIAEAGGATLSLHSPAEGRADGFEARLDLK